LRLYFAGSEAVVLDYQSDFGINNYLVSLANISITSFKRWCKLCGFEINKGSVSGKKTLMLDSGAYSIHTGTSKLTFYDYVDFVQRFGKTFDLVVSFDVIGNAESTYNNYKDMIALGLDHVIPTYHYGSPVEYFDKYCKMTDYVALGGIVTHPSNPRLTMKIIEKVIERKPKDVKLHCFGVGSAPILKKWGRYIESVDNTTWLAMAKKLGAAVTRYGKLGVYYVDPNHRQTKGEAFMLKTYNVRRFQELENDINAAIQITKNDGYVYGSEREEIKVKV
jgi:hypothetical protein